MGALVPPARARTIRLVPEPPRGPFLSHYRPRTRRGWLAVAAFAGLLLLAEPPIVHSVANRITPWVAGLPFLYAYLLALYIGLIVVLIWAFARGL